MRTKEQLINTLTLIAEQYEKANNPMGDDIRALIAKVEEGKKDHTQITIQAGITIDKFDGEDITQDPVETLHFTQEI